MGRASRGRESASRRERIAAQRAAERRRQVRNRIFVAVGAVVVVVVVAIVFVVFAVQHNTNSSTSKASGNGPTGTALATVVADTTSVPASTLATVGAGSVSGPPSALANGTPLTSGGKPEMLYIGAEYCPYCAFERWGMAVALSRFGTFKNLSTTHSSSSDEFPNTSTLTFYKSTYTSRYVAFDPVEETTNQVASNGQGYTPLQTPTSAQQALLAKYDAPPYVTSESKGAIPFVYIGGKYLINGASASPQILSGKSWASIASSLKDPGNAVAKAVDGTANYITAAICKTTGNQPSNVCTSGITALQSTMKTAG